MTGNKIQETRPEWPTKMEPMVNWYRRNGGYVSEKVTIKNTEYGASLCALADFDEGY